MPPPQTPDQRALLWTMGAYLGAVLLHVDRVPLWASAVAIGCALWRFAAQRNLVPLPGRWLRSGFVLCMLVAVVVMFRTLNGLAAGSALLVAMGAIKLLETANRRDYFIVIGSALVLLLAACLDRTGLLRVPLYLAQVWLCCSALAIVAQPNSSLDGRSAVLLAGRSLLIATPLALVLFLFFPRLPGAFWVLPKPGAAVTGLSDSMSPGSITQLTDSGEIAFRVWFEDAPPPPHERYWRGPVLHDFDGYTWTRPNGRFYRQEQLEFVGTPYRYRVTLEPHSHPWWFALDLIKESPSRRVLRSYDHLLLTSESVTQPVTYEAVSYTRSRSNDPISILARRFDTQLPAKRNPRSRELATALRAREPSDEAYVRSVLEMFRTGGFEYTLTPPRLDLDSIDDFLFNTREGFCGHYASAFVMLMRAANVPARVVTGYLGGEWNPIGDYFAISQSDAHAWAEVWIDGRGWTRVDPTGVVAPKRLQRGILGMLSNAGSAPARLIHGTPWLAQMGQAWDALNTWWNGEILGFDFGSQLSMLRLLGFDSPGWRQLGWGFAAGLTGWLLWIAWQFGRAPRAAPPDRIARAYARLCKKLARDGLVRPAHQGPIDFAKAIAAVHPEAAVTARPLLEQYARLRFGECQPDLLTTKDFEQRVSRFRVPPRVAFSEDWRTLLRKTPLYQRMPADLRLALEPVMRRFMSRMRFEGCQGLVVTDEMRLIISLHACVLIVKRDPDAYADLRSILIYPTEFVVEEVDEDEAGVVSERTSVLSGQTFDTDKIVLSWRDVVEGGAAGEAYNVVIHELAHYLDHLVGGALTSPTLGHRELQSWHEVMEREYETLCDAVDRGEPTLIDPYGAEDPAEFFAVATETFFEESQDMQRAHPEIYALLRDLYGLDPALWPHGRHAHQEDGADHEEHRH